MITRPYFVDHYKLALITGSEPRKVKEMCKRGELLYIKWGDDYLIPTAWLRRNYSQLPLYFWQEIVEDWYKGWDGPTSAQKRLERRRDGKDPSTGDNVTEVTEK